MISMLCFTLFAGANPGSDPRANGRAGALRVAGVRAGNHSAVHQTSGRLIIHGDAAADTCCCKWHACAATTNGRTACCAGSNAAAPSCDLVMIYSIYSCKDFSR